MPHGVNLAEALSAPSAYNFATHLPGKLVGHSSLTPNAAWRQELANFTAGSQEAYLSPGYWRVSPAGYTLQHGALAPNVVVNPPKVWQTQSTGDFAPPDSNDTQYRHLSFVDEQQAVAQKGKLSYVLAPREKVIGTFDPAKLTHFSPLSKVPLQTFFPPTVSAGAAARRACCTASPSGRPPTSRGTSPSHR